MLTFDEGLHEYRWNGAVVASVTQVLESVGLCDYSQIPFHIREASLKRGSRVHLATRFDDENDLDDTTLSLTTLGYLEAWRSFRRDSKFECELIEHRGYHPIHAYAGTLDRTFKDGQSKVLCDLKTGECPYWVRYQLAGYSAFFLNPRTYRRIAVELHKDATYKVFEFPAKDWQKDFDVFLAALHVHRAKVEAGQYKRREAA